MSKIFEPLTLRGITLRNRYALSPMCQYTGHGRRWLTRLRMAAGIEHDAGLGGWFLQ